MPVIMVSCKLCQKTRLNEQRTGYAIEGKGKKMMNGGATMICMNLDRSMPVILK